MTIFYLCSIFAGIGLAIIWAYIMDRSLKAQSTVFFVISMLGFSASFFIMFYSIIMMSVG